SLHFNNYQFLKNRANAFHPKRCSTIMLGSTVLGWMGEAHPDLNVDLDTTESLITAELDTQALMEAAPNQTAFVPFSLFPPVRRDLSMVTPQATAYEQISKTL